MFLLEFLFDCIEWCGRLTLSWRANRNISYPSLDSPLLSSLRASQLRRTCSGLWQIFTSPRPGLPKSYEDAAMNDKLLKCITMMSHEIKAIYRSALCEKYGNNIALASKTALCIWNMWSGVRSFLEFSHDVSQWIPMALSRAFLNFKRNNTNAAYYIHL